MQVFSQTVAFSLQIDASDRQVLTKGKRLKSLFQLLSLLFLIIAF